MGRNNLPEEQDARDLFREVRDKLKKQFKDLDDLELKTDDATTAIKYHYGIVARLEDELDKVPKDEELLLSLAENVEEVWDGKQCNKIISKRDYDKLINTIERLEAKLDRVTILDKLGRHARLLTQNIVSQGQLEELSANTKRIELSMHQASLHALSKMFYLALRKLGYTDEEIVKVAKELKRLEKDFPLIETDYENMRKMLFARPEQIPETIDADYEEVDDEIENLNNMVYSKKIVRGRNK